jgi:molybdopterin/thiamine biosynthesis adenylyltransferase
MDGRAERYSRQTLFPPIGVAGQKRLLDSRVALVGCGALGSVLGEMLTRAGVGHITLIDRDFLDWSNLQRQSLYSEEDVERRLPKAVAAAARLKALNADVQVEGIVADIQADNILKLLRGQHAILDGTDNFDTRFLLNEASIQLAIPWIYGACVSSYGITATFLPGGRPCFSCLMRDMELGAGLPTCDTAGIIAPIVHWVSSIQVSEAIKLLLDLRDQLHGCLLTWDAWSYDFHRIQLKDAGKSGCDVCLGRHFPMLNGETGAAATVLCGRNAVMLRVPAHARIGLEELEQRFRQFGSVIRNEYLVRTEIEGLEMVLFSDGRCIVRGTNDMTLARSLYARYVGH